jgi:hypothetical protein
VIRRGQDPKLCKDQEQDRIPGGEGIVP